MRVGDYVRTKKGYITKILECYGKDEGYHNMKYYSVDKWLHNGGFIIYEEDIKKSSPNIMDLIQKFDIIEFNNGSVLRVESINDKYICFFSQNNDCAGIFFDKEAVIKEIKSIVTKEQFKSMEYEVE